MNDLPEPNLCVQCGSTLPEDAKFCPQCGTRVESLADPVQSSPDPDSRTAIPTPEIPPELRERYEAARAALRGDRREVAVLFADVKGYTSLAETKDPEEIGLLMQGLLQELARAVHRWGGWVDKYTGDGVMALFGAPVAHENDAERAVEAALAMQAELERRRGTGDTGLSLRVGVNVGEVVAGHVGAESRSQYTVMGDAVNVASRLETAAEPGTVLVSESVWRRVGHRFEATEVPPLDLKGKREAVRAFLVTDRKTVVEGHGSSSPFVGRDRELGALAEWLDALGRDRSRPIVVEGEAGSGKSRLVAEALGRAEAIRPLEASFSEIRPPGAPALQVDLLQQAAGAEYSIEHVLATLGGKAEDHRTGILDLAHEADPETGAPQTGVEPEAARRNRWLALAALLRAIARDRPLVLVGENLQWAEEGELDLLEFLADGLADSPVGLLFTGRPPLERLPHGARVVPLEPLGEEAARRIVDSIGADLAAEARRDLARRGQGNPLFLEELARAAREGVELPGTLQGIVRGRIDRLAPTAQRLLQMAAVLGLRFPEILLVRMHALEEDAPPYDETVEILEAAGFLESTPDGGRRFRHALVQEVAHSGILHRVRKILHESAARIGHEVFERQDPEAEFFAHHWWEAGRPEEAAPWLWTAGRRAWEAFDLSAADRWLGRAVEAAERAPDAMDRDSLARLHETAGMVAFHRGRLDQASERAGALRALGEAAGESSWVARAFEIEGRAAWNRGHLEEARESFRRGLERVAGDAGRVAADLHNDLGVVHYYRGDAARAREHYERALSIRETRRDRPGMAKILSNLGNLWIDLEDDLDRAVAIYQRALQLAQAAGDRRLVCSATLNLGRAGLEAGDCQAALRRLVDGQETAEEIGWPYARLLAMLNRAQALVCLGRITEAIPLYEEIRREGEHALEAVGRFNARAYPFEMWIRAGEGERAEANLAEARAIAEEEDLEEITDEVALMEGRLAAARGEWSTAAEAFGRAAEAAGKVGHEAVGRIAQAHRARAAARAGRPGADEAPRYDGARRPLAALLDYLAADTAASASPSPEAAKALRQAGEAAARLGDPGLERAAFERAGEVLQTMGDAAVASVAFDRAAAAMRTLAEGLPSHLRQRFMAHPRNARLAERTGRRESPTS